MRWNLAGLTVLGCATAACASGAELRPTPLLQPHDRVRIVFVAGDSVLRRPVRDALVGEFAGADARSIHLRVASVAEPVIVPLGAVHGAYRSAGRRSRFASAVSRGAKSAAFGAVTGLLFGALASNDERLARTVAIRATGAGVVGLAIGVMLPAERWEAACYERPSP